MLLATGIIAKSDLAAIEKGLAQIRAEIRAGTFPWALEHEDVHFNIERRLTELVGEPGKRLHTARSRNDQVATDVRLYLRAAIDHVQALLKALQKQLLDLADEHAETVMPGYTHMQPAQPVSFGHHVLAYFEMFARDAQRFAECRRRLNKLPLGAAALAGTSLPIDRLMVAKELGFDGVCENSIDAVSDRDFAIEFCADAALAMTHLSRFCEEIIIWMNPRFAFVDLPDRYCTGSSIMPQKKNPDVAELVRGKTGRVNGHLVALLTLMKGQPLAYNRDNQEDKEPLFDTVDTLMACLGGVQGDAGRHQGQPRDHGGRRAAGPHDRHGPRGVPGEEGRAVPRGARGGRAGGALRRVAGVRAGGVEAHRSPAFLPGDSEGRARRAHAGRLVEEPQPHRRHGDRRG